MNKSARMRRNTRIINSAATMCCMAAGAMWTQALTGLGESLDVPPEVMAGLGGSNHWSAWAISEARLRAIDVLIDEMHADDVRMVAEWQRACRADEDE